MDDSLLADFTGILLDNGKKGRAPVLIDPSTPTQMIPHNPGHSLLRPIWASSLANNETPRVEEEDEP